MLKKLNLIVLHTTNFIKSLVYQYRHRAIRLLFNQSDRPKYKTWLFKQNYPLEAG